jgi:predicted transcriptional regulator of viral defense system
LSHFTAVQLNGLTEQLPKTVYLNHEQALASNSTGSLTQKAIDAAFKRRVRTSRNIAETDDFRVCILAGKNTGNLGVVEEQRPDLAGAGARPAKVRVTNVERTLIDAAVRPIYSGGVAEVLNAYRHAKDRVSVNRLSAMLKKLAYIYPYHQVIGFYLERAGYKPAQIELLRQEPIEFNFYLTHQMPETDFDQKWRLFIPKGF